MGMKRCRGGYSLRSIELVTVLAGVAAAGGCSAEPTASEPANDVMFTSRVHAMKLRVAGSASAAPSAGARLDYHGGKVIQNVHVVQVLYGTGTYLPELTSTSGTSMASAYTQMVTSGVLDWLGEYSTTSPVQVIGRGWFDGPLKIVPQPSRNGSMIGDGSVQSELAAQIRAGALPPPGDNRIYMVSFPSGKSLVSPDGAVSCATGGFCAYHGTFKIGSQNVYYAVLPMLTAGCATACGNATAFQNQQLVASHELLEMVTDAEVGLATATGWPLAWHGGDDHEIGDICLGQQATFVGIDNHSYTVEKGFSNQANDCIVHEPARKQHQIFRGMDDHVHEVYNNGLYWVNNDLTAVLGGSSSAGNITGYSFENTQHIMFRAADGHLHGFHEDRGWTDNDLTVIAGGAGPAGDPSGYILRNTQHIVFRSSDNHVHELYHDGGSWVNNDLTSFLKGSSAAGNPSGYVLGNTQHIVFRATDGHVHQYANDGLFWSDQDLTAVAGGTSLVGDPSGYALANMQHIAFLGTDTHVHELHHDGTRWTHHDLTAITGGVSSAGNPSGYPLSDTQHVVFRGADGHLHELYDEGSGWVHHDLTSLIGGAPPASDPSGYVLGNTQHIVFRSADNHLHEFYHDGAFWVNNDLTAIIGGSGPVDRVAGYISP
jgi:hypothetical protein